MSFRVPFNKLHHHPKRDLLLLVFGDHFQALDTRTGALIASTRALYSDSKDPENQISQPKYISPADVHNTPIRTVAFHDGIGSLFATSGEDKLLKVWDLDLEWKLKNTRPVTKRLVSIAFNKDASKIITADKFGDVFSHSLELTDDKNSCELLLGHVSMITDMLLTFDNKFIITADRDEHIRVSRFPKGYKIESFCLGHTQFISKLNILPWDSNLLLSGGGDDFIALWDFALGLLIQQLDIKQLIESQIDDKNQFKFITVSSIISSDISKHTAILIEKFPGIIILNWDEVQRHFIFNQILTLKDNPLDISYDHRGNLWIANSMKDKSNENLITMFLREDNNEYTKVSYFNPLVHQINKFGSMEVDTLPDLYTTNQLRKGSINWREKRNNEQIDDYNDSQSTVGLKNSSKKRKGQGDKKEN